MARVNRIVAHYLGPRNLYGHLMPFLWRKRWKPMGNSAAFPNIFTHLPARRLRWGTGGHPLWCLSGQVGRRSMGDFSWSLESLLPAATRREVCTCGAMWSWSTAFIICAWEPWSQVQVVLKRKIDRNEWRLFGCMYVNVQFTSFYIDSVWIESYASNWGDNCRTGLVPPSQVSIWPWRN